MSVCLITAPTVTEFADPAELRSNSVQASAREPQLGPLSLAAVLEARGETVRIRDLNRAYLDYADFTSAYDSDEFVQQSAHDLAERDFEVYGFSTICSSYPLTLRIARALKVIRPRSTILLGGPQASVVDVPTLATFPFVDLILRGEAEQTFPVLLDELRGNQQFDSVPGLTYRKDRLPQRNCSAPLIQDLDSIPFPAYHLTSYLEGANRVSLELGRGCPFSCTFCSTNDFFRRKFRLRSPERVLKDMRRVADGYSIRDFELVHDMFTVDRRRVELFCQAMIASHDGFTWSCSARTDCIDEELLALMAQAGCKGIFYGLEVGSEKMQRVIDKHLDTKRAHQIIDATERLGIESTVSLISGFPEETWDDVRQSMNFFMHAARCPGSHPQVNLLAPLSETPLLAKHKHELILEELCSCVSHQAQSQNRADVEMIAAHPEIFPNFYVIPTPHLERQCLFELREFTLMGLARFRWLLVAIDQNTSEILEFFMNWREHRLQWRPMKGASDVRQYYRTKTFHQDFISFVRMRKAGKNAVVKALLECEEIVRTEVSAEARANLHGELLSAETQLCPNDIATRTDRIAVVELKYDVQRIVDALRVCKKASHRRGRYFYITRPVSPSNTRLDSISNWMAYLLRLCDGVHTVEDIVRQLSMQLRDVPKSHCEYVCMRLLRGAQKEHFIEVVRPVRNSKAPRRSLPEELRARPKYA